MLSIINTVSMFILSSSILITKCNQGYWTFDHDVLITLENSQPAYVPFPRTVHRSILLQKSRQETHASLRNCLTDLFEFISVLIC